MIAAGIVLFDPEPEGLTRLAGAVLPEVDALYLFVNGLADEGLLDRLRALDPKVAVIRSDLNLGVGEALNILARQATLAGARRLALFDQDSGPEPGFIGALAAGLDRLRDLGLRPALVGPKVVAPATGETRYKAPRYWPARGTEPVGSLRPVRFLITSGSLIDLDAFRAVGPFRADYFIDGIDVEWGFRAWARGYSCWCEEAVLMEHRIGAGTDRALGLATPRQSAMRLYAYSRNTAYGWRLPHLPWWWKASSAAYLALQGIVIPLTRRDPALARAGVRGLIDGLAARLGPPEGAVGARPGEDERP